ncbi:MAG TPA: VCBS repeat-containing protein, partial [Candidatus Polarisedimenticolia bacterium]|nr:VCBS repeat-containing protein [Candidatus Polarisedimenticolia bacterium]
MTPVRPGQHLVLATLVMLAAVGTHRAAPLYPNPVSDTGGQGARDLVVGDFNADGHLDAAVPNDTSKDVSILLGVGDGTFGPATHYLAGQTPLQIVAGDFNADHRLDLAVLGNSPNGNVLLGLGDGTFNPVPVTGLGGGVAIAAGDLDNDGKTDLVVIYGQFSSGYYVKFISLGNGTFGVSAQNPTVSILNSVTVADVDRDGMNDVVIGAYQTIAVHRGVGGGQTADPATYPTAFWNYSVQVSDMDLDGRPDLVSQYTTQSPTPGAPQGFVHVMLARPGGGFAAGTDWPTGIYPRDLVVADFDADGKPDVAAAGQGGLGLLRGQTGGALSTPRTYGAGGFANGVAAGDLNGDGRLDAVVASLSSTLAPVVDGVYGFLGMADGTFGQPRIESLPYSRAIVRGDFDEDGHADFAVLVQFPSSQVSIVHGNGDGSFGAVQTRAFTGANPLQMVAADFNHDGHLDVAVSVDYAAVVILGTGTGGLGAPVTYSAGDPHTTIAAGDLNQDGHPDLILNNRLGTNVSVLYGVGDGTFILPSRYASGNSPEGIAVGDVDGDGRPDLVVGCRQSTSGPAGLSYLRNLGNYAFAPP